ncbi:hypothetical protein D1155_09330 [Anaerotruncus sp. 80]|uniref:BIG2 domain-containing protein n=1 Tax=Anaerotruncus colihominis TaxID=169435 RepID=A0A845QI96_9FIRM|nr:MULTISPECIES: Ig-like domain-containing protein [Anaerotruncus]NBH61850.1 hypothetical protein [Anaerotruncus colihominis]NCF02505.1 hypothetical protein [Anaerotruncus sp. 80]
MKRAIVIVLSLMMLLCSFPAGIFAEDAGDETQSPGQEEVQKIDISRDSFMRTDPSTFTYTGEELIANKVEVWVANHRLTEGVDYTLEYRNNVMPGKMEVIAKGINDYCGELRSELDIYPRSIGTYCKFNFPEFTEKGERPQFTITYGKMLLEEGKDYTVGNYTDEETCGYIEIRGIGGFSGKVNYRYETRINIAKAEVQYEPKKVYNGKRQNAEPIIVTYQGKKLSELSDYVLKYSNNIEVGTARVDIIGRGKFHGTITRYFEIAPKEQEITIKENTFDLFPKSDPVQIKAKASGDGTGFSYTSDNPAVATVDADGVIRAKAPGTAIITVKTVGSKTFGEVSTTVTVNVGQSSTEFFLVIAERKGMGAFISKLPDEKIVKATVTVGGETYPCKIIDDEITVALDAPYPQQKLGEKIIITAEDDSGKVITTEGTVENAEVYIKVNNIYDKTSTIVGEAALGATVKTVLDGKTYKTVADKRSGEFELKIPKQKFGKKIKITVTNDYGSSTSITKTVKKRKSANLEIYKYVYKSSKYAYVECSNVSAGDMIKIKIGGKTYKKKINQSKKLLKTKVYIGTHAAGTKISASLYNSRGQKLDSYSDMVYFGNKLYVGMTSKQALLTTWGKPVSKATYYGIKEWVYRSGNQVVYVYISGGKVIDLIQFVY